MQGSGYGDVLLGDTQNNVIRGGAGNDRIVGGAGNNTLDGGLGIDTVDYALSSAGVVVNLTTGVASNGMGGIDQLQGFENIIGSAYSDLLTGDRYSNVLEGGMGDDTLDGGSGNDTLIGGAGSDRYVFTVNGGVDRVIEEIVPGDEDIVLFGTNAYDQLWFRQVDDDLEISVIGTENKLIVDDWYQGDLGRIEKFQAGSRTLLDTQVDNLVSAMAAFAPPTSGQTSLPPDYQTALAPVIAANWQ